MFLRFLSEVRGEARLFLRIEHEKLDEPTLVTPTWRHRFAVNEPLKTYGLPFRLHNCVFPMAGVYSIQLWFNDFLLATQDLFLRGNVMKKTNRARRGNSSEGLPYEILPEMLCDLSSQSAAILERINARKSPKRSVPDKKRVRKQ